MMTNFSARVGSKFTGLNIGSPFTIPSGVITTMPSVIARTAREIPQIGFLTTKTISLSSRPGYREPVVHEYYPGCFINAVGLANPGARAFVQGMKPFLPLFDNKPLIVSIMGSTPEEFLECAQILNPVADAFELNLSCPHVTGAGQCIGSDSEMVGSIITFLKRSISKPIIAKLSPNLGDIPGMALVCEKAGADALCLINTLGPGIATDDDGNPVLSNVVGGLSGSGVFPVGLKAVTEAAATVKIPIIATGGISSAKHVVAYKRAGASFFGVGSALYGLTAPELSLFFSHLTSDLDLAEQSEQKTPKPAATKYFKTRVLENVQVGDNIFKLTLENGPTSEPGRFFFLRLPQIGEKPFSPARTDKQVYLIRKVGVFTEALERLNPGDDIYLRGPYGKGFPRQEPPTDMVLVGGGTGSAVILAFASQNPSVKSRGFLGFSGEISESFKHEIMEVLPEAKIVKDKPGTVGAVVEALSADVAANPAFYQNCRALVCGPFPMMEATAKVLKAIIPNERIFLSRENIMRCGIGLCGSCGTLEGLRACTDGPVMNPA